MNRPRELFLLTLLMGVGACAEGSVDGLEDVAISGGDASVIPEDDVATVPVEDAFSIPPEDVVSVQKDSGVVVEPDVPASFEDVVTAPEDVFSPREDVVTAPEDVVATRDVVTARDVVTVDAPRPDAGTVCTPPQTACSGRCVNTASDAANCGACGTACSGATPACAAGRCAAPGCGVGASDCDGNAANGCELAHMSTAACATAPNLGSWCGDVGCGFLCPSTSSRVVATRTGRASAWFRGRTNECSNCPARLDVTFTLAVPAGVDYDLFVYDGCGGRVIGSSQALAGQTDRVTINRSGDFGSDSFNWWVEVRYFSGGSCSPWTLTVQTRSNSASSC